ncbi:YceI family protein [Thermus amyloliquefaciens]|uniref:YceI family protein n=1 Tax=Thermus amyloliquefaciens TaxID=1449080 RepID=UPI00056DD172|nr:YceI family protein [Thermus amyloliquefaciens]
MRWLTLLFTLGWALAAGYQVQGEAVYEARAPLGAFQGVNPTLRGKVVFDLTTGQLQGRVCLDLTAWDSKEPLRDRHTRDMFQVDRYREACLEITGYDAQKGLVLGTLSLHGVERKVAWPLRYELEEGGKRARFAGEFELLLSDFGLKAPSFMGMRVQDRVVVRVKGQGVAQ